MAVGKGIRILTTGRAGSSMVSGIFANHGVWSGPDRLRSKQWNMKGYFENGLIYKKMKERFGRDFEGDLPVYDPAFDDEVREILDMQGATDPWFIKTGANYHDCFRELTDKTVKIYRPFEAVIDSYRRCNFLPFDKYNVEFIVQRQMELMEELPGVFVNTEDVVKGDFTSLGEAIEYCGLEFNPEIAEGFIERSLYRI